MKIILTFSYGAAKVFGADNPVVWELMTAVL